MTTTLNEREQAAIVHALRVAADVYTKDIAIATAANKPQIAQAMAEQAGDAELLADALESADYIHLDNSEGGPQ